MTALPAFFCAEVMAAPEESLKPFSCPGFGQFTCFPLFPCPRVSFAHPLSGSLSLFYSCRKPHDRFLGRCPRTLQDHAGLATLLRLPPPPQPLFESSGCQLKKLTLESSLWSLSALEAASFHSLLLILRRQLCTNEPQSLKNLRHSRSMYPASFDRVCKGKDMTASATYCRLLCSARGIGPGDLKPC